MGFYTNKQESRIVNKTRWRNAGEVILHISGNKHGHNKALNETIVLRRWATETLNVVESRPFLHGTLQSQLYDK